MDGSTLTLCRKMNRLSLEKAAELIGICTKGLWNYEKNKRVPPPDVILKMAQVYNADFLLADYCKSCLVGQSRGQPKKCVGKKKARHLRCLAIS